MGCIRPKGIVCMSGILGNEWTMSEITPMEDLPSPSRLTIYIGEATNVSKESLQDFIDAVEKRSIKLNIDRIFKLDELAIAHQYIENNKASGMQSPHNRSRYKTELRRACQTSPLIKDRYKHSNSTLAMHRKDFLLQMTGTLLMPQLFGCMDINRESGNSHQLEENMTNQVDWKKIKSQFLYDDKYVNLRAFASSPVPKETAKRFVEGYTHIQAFSAHRNHASTEESKKVLREKISAAINCSIAEVAVMRSTTEALNNAIMGIKMKAGDEVLASVHEYDSMVASFVQRQEREGIVVTKVDVPYQPSSSEEIVNYFKNSVTPKTRVILLSHIIWISGQIYPIQEICQWARERNIITVIDAAQSFSHINIDVEQIGCDYLGASLHKWCAAPLGTGFLYVRKDRIAETFPLFASYGYTTDSPNIEKFENIGASTPVFDSCIHSLDFWKKLGSQVKMERTQYLKSYLADKLAGVKNVKVVTNLDREHSCGIIYLGVGNKSATAVKKELFEKHNVLVQAIEGYKNLFVDYDGVNCIGVATPVFVLEEELDYFTESLSKLT